jgi:hypothetical protein
VLAADIRHFMPGSVHKADQLEIWSPDVKMSSARSFELIGQDALDMLIWNFLIGDMGSVAIDTIPRLELWAFCHFCNVVHLLENPTEQD